MEKKIDGNDMNGPNYRRIYMDILDMKFPGKKRELEKLLNKKVLSELDVLSLNNRIFGNTAECMSENMNRKYRSFSKTAILKILDYQEKNQLNNSQLASHFKLSRNTVTKWRLVFKR